MCSNPKVFIKLKTKYDMKFRLFAKKSRIIYLGFMSDYVKRVVNGSFTELRPSCFGYDDSLYDVLIIPCGCCMTCRLSQSAKRSAQGYCEFKTSSGAKFITLTFGDNATVEHLKSLGYSDYYVKKYSQFLRWSLEKNEFQKFMKRLRDKSYQQQLRTFCRSYEQFHKYLYNKDGSIRLKIRVNDFSVEDKAFFDNNFNFIQLRYMHCGEYGSKHGRPHHHLILFNSDHLDFGVWQDSHYVQGRMKKVNRSTLLSDLWKFGDSSCDDCNYNTINYVCRYVTKKIVGVVKDSFYSGRKPEYMSCSNRPGIGYSYFYKYADSLIARGCVQVKTKKGWRSVSLPRYFRDLYKREHPYKYAKFIDENSPGFLAKFNKILKEGFLEDCMAKHFNSLNVFRTLVRGYESEFYDYDSFLSKCDVFGIPRSFAIDYPVHTNKLLENYSWKDFESPIENEDIRECRKKFESWKQKTLNKTYDFATYFALRHRKDVDIYTFLENIQERVKSLKNPFDIKNRSKKILPPILNNPIESQIVYNGKIYA